ncbi:Rhomboid family protein [Rubripirellula tenax]|uniref:Rhomboid family protein n=1 Tax=Rubripirellula tenax TaxID=2528015 RepID=A0A5C6EJH3_9BACT|nr:rhomboid family intramembrane serine protease [Rubripirellula tenax]TWU48674.1 Rhomboid family protein [Rubripirellula tenax]
MSRVVVHQTDSRRQCSDLRLALAAVGIAGEGVMRDGSWSLLVDESNQSAAIDEIEGYLRDNAESVVTTTRPLRLYGGALAGVFAYAVIVNAITVTAWTPPLDQAWNEFGRMKAGDVMSGQWWRAFTALSLHVDLQHWLSNLAFGGVFGFLVGRVLGGGVGWLAILLAGGIGNYLNAMMRDADHGSIGASTAVFGALGVMVAHAMAPRTRSTQSAMKRYSPLVGGVLMFAMLGIGDERTDVGAHASGLFAGFVIGWIACRMPEQWLARGDVQWGAGTIAVGILALSWIVALS